MTSMTHHTKTGTIYTTQFYDNLVVACAAALRAYPQDKARLHKAALLILDGKVLHETDTSAVLSQSTPGVVYSVNGTCGCKAFPFAPGGRCVHRWAVALYKKALQPHSVERRDGEAAAGHNLAAVVCSPAHLQADALQGHGGPTSPAALELPSRARCAQRGA